ncbi:unnamed protein product [Gongylonema pulchrum]|uniref:SAC domain-containing protein n=1 Tax=Gongylonema pulchrum TaxID=637853 RepID=A0A183DDT3_9BILA|nr:unnamed protein product [Gongylonema pulchrum]
MAGTNDSNAFEKSGKTWLVAISQIVRIDGKYVNIDLNGRQNVLARVSIVNCDLKCLYDRYVKPEAEVTDYRTHLSGLRLEDVENDKLLQSLDRYFANFASFFFLMHFAIQIEKAFI